MKRPWLLAELSYKDLKDRLPEVVVLPFGATEPHNLHLPYGTDCLEADLIAGAICKTAQERGAHAVCLPTIPYGTETNQAAFPLSPNLQPSTILLILKDLVRSLENSGVRKCLILNSHGGNEFKGHLRELYGSTSVHLFLANWYQLVRDLPTPIFEKADDHAGEMETSIILHTRPDLVDLAAADEGAVRATRFAAVNRGWVTLTRPWHLLTTNTGAGDPRAATSAKGEEFLRVVVDRLADFLVELAAAKVDEKFPF